MKSASRSRYAIIKNGVKLQVDDYFKTIYLGIKYALLTTKKRKEYCKVTC